MSNISQYSFIVSHVEDGWITPLVDAVEAVGQETATWQPGDGVPSIADLTLHAVNYLENLGRRLNGQPIFDHEDWPESQGSWPELQARVRAATSAVKDALSRLTDAELAKEVDGQVLVERVLDLSIHGAYHAGQVVKLTQVYEATRTREAAGAR